MKKTPKLLLLVLGSMFLASIAFTACNSDDKKTTTTDTITTPKMDSMPVIKMDTAHTRPTPTGN